MYLLKQGDDEHFNGEPKKGTTLFALFGERGEVLTHENQWFWCSEVAARSLLAVSGLICWLHSYAEQWPVQGSRDVARITSECPWNSSVQV